MKKERPKSEIELYSGKRYGEFVGEIGALLNSARRATARAANAVMTTAYWEVGRRIVEFEQCGEARAGYGKQLLKRLSHDLTEHFGKGFSEDNLERFRLFYRSFPVEMISATASRKSRGDASEEGADIR